MDTRGFILARYAPNDPQREEGATIFHAAQRIHTLGIRVSCPVTWVEVVGRPRCHPACLAVVCVHWSVFAARNFLVSNWRPRIGEGGARSMQAKAALCVLQVAINEFRQLTAKSIPPSILQVPYSGIKWLKALIELYQNLQRHIS